jgi:hypothetical protein
MAIEDYKKEVISVSTTELSELIATATTDAGSAIVGTGNGQYPQAAIDALLQAITDAQSVVDKPNRTDQEVQSALLALNTAIADFKAQSITVDVTELSELIAEAIAISVAAVLGEAKGQYPPSAIDALETAIAEAQLIAAKPNITAAELTSQLEALSAAITTFNSQVIIDEVGAVGSGDFDGDGILTINDVSTLVDYIAYSNMTLTTGQTAAIDIDGDGAITMADAVLSLRRLLGL